MRYIKLHSNTSICQSLTDHAKNTNIWQVKHSFSHITIPLETLLTDKFLKYIIENFEVYAVIFKMNPFEFYRFHTDDRRKCAVNMLLSGFDSHCYFGEGKNQDNLFTNIEELVYENNTFYLFNTLVPHAIMNLSEPRYLFSLGIYNHNYDHVKNVLQLNL